MSVEQHKIQSVTEPEREPPEITLETEDGYEWVVFSKEQTGLRLVGLYDSETGVVVTSSFANPEKRTAAHKAWAGARHSRAPGMPWEIMREMGEKGVDPDQKLDETFRGYGHASVGDMASLELDIVKCPMHLCMTLFNETAINSGQEKSTRYQRKFGKAILHSINNYLPQELPKEEVEGLEKEYQEFGDLSLQLFAKHQEKIDSAFRSYFKPQDKAEDSSLRSRTLDCVRYFLLLGQGSGLSLETSARDWARIIGELKASPLHFYGRVANQIERFLTPSKEEEELLKFKAEAPSLIKYTQPSETTNKNLGILKDYFVEKTDLEQNVITRRDFRGSVEQVTELIPDKYTEGERMVAQYALTLWPGMDKNQLLDWVHSQSITTKKEISLILFNDHNNYRELPQLARTSRISLMNQTFLGEVRDWNRHRAWGRFINLPLVNGSPVDADKISQILASGYGLPLYLTEIPEFSDVKSEFEVDLATYYQKLYGFVGKIDDRYGSDFDYSFAINLLPLAHQVDLWMHGDPKQALYMTHQRSKPGGHINYRAISFSANQLIADSDPYLEGMRLPKRPDPSNRDEFFNRS